VRMNTLIRRLGSLFLDLIQELGRLAGFLLYAMYTMFRSPGKPSHIVKQIHFIGAKSLFVVVLTAAFTGMVLGLQGYYTLAKFGSEGLLGSAVALSLVRE